MSKANKKSAAIQLTRLESEVMSAVWAAHPDGVRVREVLQAVNAKRSAALAYNTVQTVMNILVKKGVLASQKSGRALEYTAQIPRDQVSRNMVNDFVDRLFGGQVAPLLHQLVQDSDLDVEQLKELRKWVNARLRDAKGD